MTRAQFVAGFITDRIVRNDQARRNGTIRLSEAVMAELDSRDDAIRYWNKRRKLLKPLSPKDVFEGRALDAAEMS